MLYKSRIHRLATSQAEVVINAPQQVIWDILIDLGHYSEWNPFTAGASGVLAVGQHIVLTVHMNERNTLGVTEIVRVIEPPHTLAWGSAYPKWLLDATRYQVLIPLSSVQTRYQTWETFGGPLGILVAFTQKRDVERGFEAAASALKARAEQSL